MGQEGSEKWTAAADLQPTLPKSDGRSGMAGGVAGFDTGPGNVLMDLWCSRHTGASFDAAGAWAGNGKPSLPLLAELLNEPYFRRPAPKSTGRDLFNERWLARALKSFGVSTMPPPVDIQATLLELTAHTICDALSAHAIDALYACGGGAHNHALMQRLQTLMPAARVETTASLGVPPDWVEAVAFAWFALQAIDGIPANLPQVTGARGPRILGAIYPA